MKPVCPSCLHMCRPFPTVKLGVGLGSSHIYPDRFLLPLTPSRSGTSLVHVTMPVSRSAHALRPSTPGVRPTSFGRTTTAQTLIVILILTRILRTVTLEAAKRTLVNEFIPGVMTVGRRRTGQVRTRTRTLNLTRTLTIIGRCRTGLVGT